MLYKAIVALSDILLLLLKYLSNKEYVVFDYDFRESTSFVKDKKLAPEQCNLSVIRNNKWK